MHGNERWDGLDSSSVVFSNASLSDAGRCAIGAVGRAIPDAVAALISALSLRSRHADTGLRPNSIPEIQDRPEIERFVQLAPVRAAASQKKCAGNQ